MEEDRKLITTGCFKGWYKIGPVSIGPHKDSFDGCLGVLGSLGLISTPFTLDFSLSPTLFSFADASCGQALNP